MCRLFRWLFAVLPLPALRARLIARHLESCPACASRLAEDEALRRLLPPPAWLAEAPDLWPGIAAGIRRLEAGSPRRPAAFPRLRWAVVGTLAAMLLLPLLYMLRRPAPRVVHTRPASFALLSATIDGQPATPYVFQAPDSDLVIVWLEKN